MKRKLRKFVKKHRKNGNPSFKLLTTMNELIFVAEDGEQLRLKYS